jgi:hypothetical protein
MRRPATIIAVILVWVLACTVPSPVTFAGNPLWSDWHSIAVTI